MIALAISDILSNDPDVQERIGDNHAPLAVPIETEGTHVTYTTTSLEPTYTKASPHAANDTYTVDLETVADSYADCVVTAHSIRLALEKSRGEINGLNVVRVTLQASSNFITDDSKYLNKQIFSITIKH